MQGKGQLVHFLESVILQEHSSIPLRSSFSLRVLSHSEKERDGGIILKENEGGRTLLKVKPGHLKKRTNLILCAQQIVFGEFNIVARKIDGVVSERIVEYVEQYYGKYRTNCATFVEYMRTGFFTKYDSGSDHQIFSAGVNLYTTQKIEPGDTLCVLYYRKEVTRRHKRLREIRKHCRRNKKLSDLTHINEKSLSRTLSPKEITNLCQSTIYGNYHFLYCIGTNNGEPILIHQIGLIEPEEQEQEKPAIVISIGTTNLYTNFIPAHMFIKKGRLKRP